MDPLYFVRFSVNRLIELFLYAQSEIFLENCDQFQDFGYASLRTYLNIYEGIKI